MFSWQMTAYSHIQQGRENYRFWSLNCSICTLCGAHIGEDVQKLGIFSQVTDWDHICNCLWGVYTAMMPLTLEMILSRACALKRKHLSGCKVTANFHAVALGNSSAQQHESRICYRAQFSDTSSASAEPEPLGTLFFCKITDVNTY